MVDQHILRYIFPALSKIGILFWKVVFSQQLRLDPRRFSRDGVVVVVAVICRVKGLDIRLMNLVLANALCHAHAKHALYHVCVVTNHGIFHVNPVVCHHGVELLIFFWWNSGFQRSRSGLFLRSSIGFKRKYMGICLGSRSSRLEDADRFSGRAPKQRQDNARRDETRQHKARKYKSRQDKIRQDITRQDKTTLDERQENAMQDETTQHKRQDKTLRQDITRQDKT